MTLSQAARQAITILTKNVPDFTVYSGIPKPIPMPLVLSEDVRDAIETLNYFSYRIFPTIEADEPGDLYDLFPSATPAEFAFLEEIAPLIACDLWRARVYEQLWAYRTPKTNPQDAFNAAQAYLAYVQRYLNQPQEHAPKFNGWTALERALRLTAKYASHPMGRPIYLQAQAQAKTWVGDVNRDVEERSVNFAHLVDTWKLVESGLTKEDLLALCEALDAEHKITRNYTWRHNLAKYRERLVKNGTVEEKRASRLHFAQLDAAEGDYCAPHDPVRAKFAYMHAERRFQDLNMTTEVQQMQQKGAALAPAIFSEMKPMEVEIGDYLNFCQYIAKRRLREATSLQEYLELLAEHHAVQPKADDPDPPRYLHQLFGQTHFGGAGQVVNNTGNSGEVGYPLDEMHHAAQLSAMIYSELYEAAQQRWAPMAEDLHPGVAASNVVPRQHIELVTLGLTFALQQDFLVAAHLLAPMPEAIFRHVLVSKRKLAPYTEASQIQMMNTLAPMIDTTAQYYPELVSVFGEDIMLDAKRVLDTESLNVRNTLLHGLGGDKYAADWPGRALVQLVFRLVFGPHHCSDITTGT